MTHKLYFALSFLCVISMIAVHCGNSPSRAATTSSALPVAATPQAANEPAAPQSARAAGQVEIDEPVVSEPSTEVVATAIHEAIHDAEGLEMRRLSVARDVENREPVGAASRFVASNEKLYAFMELVNTSDEARQVLVTFENEDGASVGHITVNIPANAPRWRTWAYSRRVNRPGTWTAIITTPEGTELGRERFEIEG